MSAAAKPDEKAAEVADKEKPVENIDALEVRYPRHAAPPPHTPSHPYLPRDDAGGRRVRGVRAAGVDGSGAGRGRHHDVAGRVGGRRGGRPVHEAAARRAGEDRWRCPCADAELASRTTQERHPAPLFSSYARADFSLPRAAPSPAVARASHAFAPPCRQASSTSLSLPSACERDA